MTSMRAWLRVACRGRLQAAQRRLKPSLVQGRLKPAPTSVPVLALLVLATGAWAQEIKPSPYARAPMLQPPPAGQIEILPIRGNLYALLGAGNNVVISVGG